MNLKSLLPISVFLFLCSNAFAFAINLDDVTPPDLSNCSVTDASIECSGADNETLANNWNAANIADLVACVDGPGFTFTSDYDFNNLVFTCGQSGTLGVTYTVTDDSGNSTTLNAILILDDTTSPIWDVLPSDLNVNCEIDYQAAYETWLNSFSGTDSCSTTTLSHDAPATITCPQLVTVNFELYDACLNATIASAAFEVEDTFSISEVEKVNIEMYPNPTESRIRFKGLIDNSTIEVFNILGKKVLATTINNIDALQLNLHSGLYMVKISSGTKTEIKKLIIK